MRAYTATGTGNKNGNASGSFDRDFVRARIDEIRAILADESVADAAVDVESVDTATGYRLWSATYDQPNSAFDVDEPVIRQIIDEVPAGDALDAACGTGRMSRFLAERGHQVVGVDGSPEMLARARLAVPKGDFLLGELQRLPVADAKFDLVVCTLALTHVQDLEPVMAQFARVLRPDGHLVLSDMHPETVMLGSIPRVRHADGRPGRVNSYRHLIGDYIRAALPVGLQVRRCEEPLPPASSRRSSESDESSGDGSSAFELGPLGPWDGWPWSLAHLIPEAARVVGAGTPGLVIWHFQLDQSA